MRDVVQGGALVHGGIVHPVPVLGRDLPLAPVVVLEALGNIWGRRKLDLLMIRAGMDAGRRSGPVLFHAWVETLRTKHHKVS